MLLTGHLNILQFLLYVLAQFLGAFFSASIVFLVYIDALKSYKAEMYSLDTAGIFATYPNLDLSVLGGFVDQFTASCLLVMAILAINDKNNFEFSHGTKAILVGFVLIVIGCSFGFNCGYAVNPARDFGPRLFTLLAGWGVKTLVAGNYFFWIPLVAPMVGSVAGTFIYLLCISIHF